MTDRPSPEREVAHLRYQLAAQAAAAVERDATIARLRIQVGEMPAPPPIVVPEPAPRRVWTPPAEPPRAKAKHPVHLKPGWIVALLRERGPMTTAELCKAANCTLGTCRVAQRNERAHLVGERTGSHLELRYRLQDQAAPVPFTPRGPRPRFGRSWVFAALTAEPQSADDLVAKTGRSRASVQTALSENRSAIAVTGHRRARRYALAAAAPLADAG